MKNYGPNVDLISDIQTNLVTIQRIYSLNISRRKYIPVGLVALSMTHTLLT